MSALLRTSFRGLVLIALIAFGQAAEPRTKTNAFFAQFQVPRIDQMPARPTPFTVIDWNKLARDFDAQRIGGCHAFDFWGDVLPSLLAMELGACYPQKKSLDEPLRITADQFVRAADVLLSTPEKFAWSTVDFRLMKPVRNIVPVQRDAAGGFAALLYWAHQRFGDRKYLEASLRCLDYLDSLQENPVYAWMQNVACNARYFYLPINRSSAV